MIEFDRQRAYVLHTRPLRETSVIAELVVEGEGRVVAVYRVGRSQAARPFVRYLASVRGRGDLPRLTALEESGGRLPARGALVDGLYLNELILKLLPARLHAPELWDLYDEALRGVLSSGRQIALRRFESKLLALSGCVFDLDSCGQLVGERLYRHAHDQAPVPADRPGPGCVRGTTLTALARGLPEETALETLSEAADLLQHLISLQTGGRKLQTEALRKSFGQD